MWTGQFADRTLEGEFSSHQFQRELRAPLIVSAWVTAFFWAVLAGMDYWLIPDVAPLALGLRLGVVVPISVVLALITMSPWAEQTQKLVGSAHIAMGLLFYIGVGSLTTESTGLLYTAYAVLFLLLVPGLTRLGVVATGVSAVGAVLIVLAFAPLTRHYGWGEVLFFTLFFGVAGIYQAWTMWASEGALRKAYWQGRVIEWQVDAIGREQEAVERLLLNVLPPSIAERLKRADAADDEGQTIADSFPEATVLFADIVGFTVYSSQVSAEVLVARLDQIFSRFDEIAERNGLEKIKTIGDAYMAAAGLPEKCDDHAERVARMALEMQEAIAEISADTGDLFRVRVGIHSGPVVAGVIGRSKFIYDLWGDTVNIASRMESHGEPGKVQLSESTAKLLEGSFEMSSRGEIEVKGKGKMRTFWLLSSSPPEPVV